MKPSDLPVLRTQLDSSDINVAGVLVRCTHGYPVVVLLDPLVQQEQKDKSPINFMAISTLLWLTCPYLNERIHELESRGCVDRIEKFIRSDRTVSSLMMHAHASFYFLRKRVYCRYAGGLSSLEENRRVLCTGIGGIRDMENIRCLHMHYAHYLLYPENPAGRVTGLLLEGKTCCEKGLCGTCTS